MEKQKLITYDSIDTILLPLQEKRCFFHESMPDRINGVTVSGRSYNMNYICNPCHDETNPQYTWAKLNGLKEK